MKRTLAIFALVGVIVAIFLIAKGNSQPPHRSPHRQDPKVTAFYRKLKAIPDHFRPCPDGIRWVLYLSECGSDPLTQDEVVSRALQIAYDWWGRAPLCGTPRTVWRPLVGNFEAQTRWESCTIYINAPRFSNVTDLKSGEWPWFCTTVVHEVGHLVLGPYYFYDTNPSDPAHSPDSTNVMYATLTHVVRPCERW